MDEPAKEVAWRIQDCAPAPTALESNLELQFRAAFVSLLHQCGAVVKETPGPKGKTIQATLGGVPWTLEPQVMMHGCNPDFVLTSPGVPQVAIFTDGFAYHATPAHNRVADDAGKRAALRAAGLEVLAFTYADVERYVDHKSVSQPPWFSPQASQTFMSLFNYNSAAVVALLDGPFAQLAAWIQNPLSEPPRRLAQALPLFFVDAPAAGSLDDDDPVAVAAELMRSGEWPSAKGDWAAWWWTEGPLGVLVRVRDLEHIDLVVVLDDRPQAVASTAYRKYWQEWLRLSDAVLARPATVLTQIVALTGVPTVPAPSRLPLTAPYEWATALRLVVGDRAILLARELAASGAPAPDLVGEELGAGVPVELGWMKARVVVIIDPQEGEVASIESDGWTVVGPDMQAVLIALATKED
jgi:hypothetical protein